MRSVFLFSSCMVRTDGTPQHFCATKSARRGCRVKKQHGALFLVPGVIATALEAQKRRKTACVRRVAEQVPSTAPTEKTIILSSFFSFYRVLSFLFFDIMFYFVLLSSTFHGINSYISFKFLLQKCLECVLLHL